MIWRKKFTIITASAFLSFFLAGCSGAPSSSDIEKSIRAGVDEGNLQAKQFAGELFSNDMLTQLHGAKKIGCAKLEAPMGYNCDVELDMTTPTSERRKTVVPFRFVQTDDGWRALR